MAPATDHLLLNMLILGLICRGKCALVKVAPAPLLAPRHSRRCLRRKGEYSPLARALGCKPLRLEPGGTVRLNPLDPRSTAPEQTELVEVLAATAPWPDLSTRGTQLEQALSKPAGETPGKRRFRP